jgi:hypothetical protein
MHNIQYLYLHVNQISDSVNRLKRQSRKRLKAAKPWLSSICGKPISNLQKRFFRLSTPNMESNYCSCKVLPQVVISLFALDRLFAAADGITKPEFPGFPARCMYKTRTRRSSIYFLVCFRALLFSKVERQ